MSACGDDYRDMTSFVEQIRQWPAPFVFAYAIETAASAIRPEFRRSAFRRAAAGVEILESEERLNDYLVAYGEMHVAKLMSFLPSVPLGDVRELVLVDWGCGQGLASAVALEYLRKANPEVRVVAVRLMEVSNAARRRAVEIVRRYENASDVRAYPWDLDAFSSEISSLPRGVAVLHLFSNILDVVSAEAGRIAEIVRGNAEASDCHVLCVGPKGCSTAPTRSFYGCFGSATVRRVSDSCVPVCGRYYPYGTCSCYGLSFSLARTPAVVLPATRYYPEDLFAFAAANMADAIVEAVRSGVDVNSVDGDGSTAVLLAAKFGAVEALKTLVGLRADVELCNSKGASPLYFAAKYGEAECLSVLLSAGADTECRITTSGLTPYLVAAKYGRVECMRLLSDAGCDVGVCDARGRSAELLAKFFSKEEGVI